MYIMFWKESPSKRGKKKGQMEKQGGLYGV